MAAETLHQLHGDERFDLVVVDTPPSRNALDFLEAPGVLARFLDHRLFRLMMLPARGGMRVVNAATQPMLRAIGKVVGSDVLADAVAFFQAFAGMEAGFRERADDVIALLRSDATRYVIVASPHRDTVERGGVVRRPARRAGHHPPGRRRQPGPPAVRRRAPSAEAAAHAERRPPSARRRPVAQRRRAAGAGRGGGRRAGPVRRHARRRPAGRGARCSAATCTTSPGWARSSGTSSAASVTPAVLFRGVHVLLATDAQWLVDDVVAALGGPDTSFTVCSEGRDVAKVVEDRTAAGEPSTSASSTSRSARWAGWRSRWRCASTPRAGGCPTSPC